MAHLRDPLSLLLSRQEPMLPIISSAGNSEEKGTLTPITTPLILGMVVIIRLIFTNTGAYGTSTKAPTAAKPEVPSWLALSKKD